jgi:ribosomal protein S18 acetylase RimI-like enzyme
MTAPHPARVEEYAAAFRLLFAYLPPQQREERTAHALFLVQRGEVDPHGLFVVGEAQPQAAFFCQAMPGAAALVWPPCSIEDAAARQREDVLMRHGIGWLRDQGVKVAQTLLQPELIAAAGPLLRHGFRHVTSLCSLRHPLRGIPAAPALPLVLRPYEDDPSLFAATLERTYQGTLDCPELNDVRSVEEALECHRGQAGNDPGRWRLALLDERPAGVLLPAELPDSGEWDVSYVGVVPELRRRGVARFLLVEAMHAAQRARAPQLTLSVDGRNEPARRLYAKLGFDEIDTREVFLLLRP